MKAQITAPVPPRLLGLMALGATATAAVVVAGGRVHSADGAGAAAAIVGMLAVGAYGYHSIARYRGRAAAAAVEPALQQEVARERSKKFLILLVLVGALSYFGAKGTFATFSAETTNVGSSAASGTLTLSDQVASQTACVSAGGASGNNVNASCGALFNIFNLAPGTFAGLLSDQATAASPSVQVTVKNTGSIDASKLYLWAPQASATLGTALTQGNSVTSLTVSGLEGMFSTGDTLVVSAGFHTQNFTVTNGPYEPFTTATLNGNLTSGNSVTSLTVTNLNGTIGTGDSIVLYSSGHTQTFVVTGGPYSAGSTTVNVTSQAANFSYQSSQTLVSDYTTSPTTVTVSSTPANYSYPTGASITDNQSNGVKSTLSSGLSTGGAITSLPVAALPGQVNSGDNVTVSSGGNTQTFVASATAASGATAISVYSQTPNFAYPSGTTSVLDAANAECQDSRTTTAGTAGATKGTDLNFNSPANNPLCGTLLIAIQETTGGPTGNEHYCWAGKVVTSGPPANAMCAMPISVNLSSPLSTGGAITSLPVASLNGNVASGDTIALTSGSNTQTFTASGNVYVGATSIPVSSQTPNFAYPTTTVVTDTKMQTTLLDSDQTDTITNFDTGHSATGQIQLYPISADGTQNNTATVELGKAGSSNDTRTFQVGLYLPKTNLNQNAVQGLKSLFGLTWHIDQ